MDKSAKIFVAGHRGLVGSAIVRQLQKQGYQNIITRLRSEVDLSNQVEVERFFDEETPEYVFLAAAKVGGIHANNTFPAEFVHENLTIQTNVIHQAYRHDVKRLLFLGSSCIYPKSCPQPIKEEYLLTSELEPTNRPYALAKIAGIEMCWSYNRQYGTQYLSVMPTNLFGPGDNYDLETSHVLPALMRKVHLAKLASNGDVDGILKDEKAHGNLPSDYRNQLITACEHKQMLPIEVWGTGLPKRELMYSEDMAEACLYLMNLSEERYQHLLVSDANNTLAPIINVGLGKDVSIEELTKLIAAVVGYDGAIVYDKTKPDGTLQKVMSIEKLHSLGWQPSTGFKERLEHAYQAYTSETEAKS